MDFWKLEEAVDIHGEVALSQALQQHAQFLRYMGMVASGITFSFALWFVTLVILWQKMEPFILILNLGWLCDSFPSPCPDITRAVCSYFSTLLPCLKGHTQLLLCWVWEPHKRELSHSTWRLGHGAIFSLYESGKWRGDRVSRSDSLNTRITDAMVREVCCGFSYSYYCVGR